MPDFKSLAEQVIGHYEAVDELSPADVELDEPRVQNQLNKISNVYIKDYKSPHTKRGFKVGDFQIGSVILPVAPSAVRINRIRDVHTVPIMRGASIPARQGEGVTTIDITVDIPDYTTEDGRVNAITAMIAEFKLSPFTTIRNRDLSSKVSQVNIHEPPEIIRDALANIRNFTAAERILRKQFDQFFVTVNEIGNSVAADWQRNLRLRLSQLIADISTNPTSFEFTKSEELEGEYFEAMTSTEGLSPSEVISELYQIFKQGEIIQPGDINSSKDDFGEAMWDDWNDLWRSNVWNTDTTKAIRDLILASRIQQEINKRARDTREAAQAPRPPIFIPVVLTRMVFRTKPGNTRCARVDMSFELFNFRAYVDKFEWHHYNGSFWTTTEDASQADLLLRWRDQQFLTGNGRNQLGYVDMSKITLDELNKKINTEVDMLSTGSNIPGYFKYLRAAWRNRRCMTPPSDPKQHLLKVFYPESIPQVHNSAAQAVGGFYRELELDDGKTDYGVTTQVAVVWDLGIARQPDEFTGTVIHQSVGGSTINVTFDIAIPIHQTAIEGDSVHRHEEIIGRVNRMFDTIEQNRRILPSDAFMPTSVFILNPITQMFGAYVFEAGDMPVVQYEPGCAKLSLQLSEAIPVVGLGEFKNRPIKPSETDGSITREQAFRIAVGMAFFFNRTDTTTTHKHFLEKRFQQIVAAYLGVRSSIPKLPLSREPLKSFNEITPPDNALKLLSYADRVNNIANTTADPWTPQTVKELKEHWASYIKWQGSYYELPKTSEKDTPSYLIDIALDVTLLRYLDPRFQQSGSSGADASWLTNDPISETIDALRLNRHTTIGDRFAQIQAELVQWEYLNRRFVVSMFTDIPKELIPEIQEYLSQENLFHGDLAAVLDRAEQIETKRFGVGYRDPRTYMLYPDMVLPTVREVLGVNPEDDLIIPDSHLTHFIPTFAEYGTITANPAEQHQAGRKLDDLADPDIWYARQIERPILQSETGDKITYNRDETSDILTSNQKAPTTRNGRPGTGFLKSDTTQFKNLSDLGKMNTSDYLASVDIEQLAKPNRKRMLFAFPTYALEFTLDGTKARRLTQSAQLPMGWEARFINSLPVVKLEVNLDSMRPNIATLDFISRRAALRNESWHWLVPDIEIDEDVFTNIPDRVQEILNEDFPIRSDPTLLTKLILSTGTRVSVRMGYGSDLNNVELLPTILSGTIGEIALGEMSSMKVQDIGMQLANPLEKTFGGTGNYSPNRIWSGKFTMRAFTDIFHGLDTKFMGRSGRGTEVDLVHLTDNEIGRIYDIGIQTRTSVEVLRAEFAEAAMGALHTLFHNPVTNFLRYTNPALFLGQALTASETFRTGSALLRDKTSRFYPELLNVYPCVTGISDWAISNTDAKGIQATYWIDMLARLNPGCIWWTHPFGNESRLFFGRPEQYYRKYPLVIPGDQASTFYQLTLNSTVEDLEEEELDPSGFAQELVVAKDSFRGNVIEYAGYAGYVPSDRADILRAFIGFETTVNQPDQIDEYYRRIWVELAKLEVRKQSGKEIKDFLAGNYTQEDYQRLIDFKRDPRGPDQVALPEVGTLNASHWVSIYGYMLGLDLSNVDFVKKLGLNYAEEFPEEFRSLESFSRYLKRLSSVFVAEGELLDNDELPAETSAQLSRYLWGELPKFAGVLLRALNESALVERVSRISQVTKALSAARHLLGYRRFRQYHHVLSGRDLLTNRMMTSQAKMANAVQVDTYTIGYSVLPFERRVISLEADIENLNFGIFQWFKGLLGENDRDKILGILIPNALARGMARMYDGIIEVRGNQQIKPHDIIYMLDLHNGIYGPVKCKTVMHSLDSVSGFVTRIVPELHTESFSSRVLSEHVANQRIMKTIATTALVAGIGAALLGGPVGLIAGVGLAASAAALSTYASLSDTIARRQLINFSAAETLSQAKSREEAELVMKHMMLDTFVSSNKIKAISPTEAKEQGLVKKMVQANNPELGVSIFPLMRFGSYVPIVAGLRTEGLIPVDTSFAGVTSEAAKIVKGAVIDMFDVAQVLDYIGENVDDIQSGWRATMNAIEREVESKRRAERALRRRGVRVR